MLSINSTDIYVNPKIQHNKVKNIPNIYIQYSVAYYYLNSFTVYCFYYTFYQINVVLVSINQINVILVFLWLSGRALR